ncbi:MAG: phenylacetate-CoA oxygenase subunit PaaJ [Bacteroidetes bacterium]|nr:phenylacetate-CoA oxygenase subunit PaaJ [Bacteroidota bacterium]
MVSTRESKQLHPEIWEALYAVKDPEIPPLSIVDLGIVTSVEFEGKGTVQVNLTPTFSGCPALKIMEQLVVDKLHESGFEHVQVKTSFEVAWNSNMISEEGLKALHQHGLAPPPRHEGYIELDVLSDTPCPLCGSRNTTMQTPFGPTLCRSMHYCKNCSNAFEAFKPVS